MALIVVCDLIAPNASASTQDTINRYPSEGSMNTYDENNFRMNKNSNSNTNIYTTPTMPTSTPTYTNTTNTNNIQHNTNNTHTNKTHNTLPPIIISTTHLKASKNKKGEKFRTLELKQLLSRINNIISILTATRHNSDLSLSGPKMDRARKNEKIEPIVILTGDLNASPKKCPKKGYLPTAYNTLKAHNLGFRSVLNDDYIIQPEVATNSVPSSKDMASFTPVTNSNNTTIYDPYYAMSCLTSSSSSTSSITSSSSGSSASTTLASAAVSLPSFLSAFTTTPNTSPATSAPAVSFPFFTFTKPKPTINLLDRTPPPDAADKEVCTYCIYICVLFVYSVRVHKVYE